MRTLLLVTFISLLLIPQVPAQVSDEKEIHESLDVELVDLYLTATDKKGHFVTDLKPEELIVQEDHVPQSIQRFGSFAGKDNEVPVILAMLIDTSASMDEEIQEVKKLYIARDTAIQLTQELGPLDRMMLVQFNEKMNATPLTSDREMVGQTLHQLRPYWKQTALFDALASTIRELKVEPGRKVLFLSSDGQDNMSKTKLDEIIKMATDTPELTMIILGTVPTDVDHVLYKTVQKRPPPKYFRGSEILKDLANRTAGYVFFPASLKDVNGARELMRSFIRSQYFLAYQSTNHKMDGAWRNIQISCKRNGVTLRYRSGYNAPKTPA
jgi:VWFA-related protein